VAQVQAQEEIVNKAELIDALSARLGDKRAANQALDAVLTEIQNTVTKGGKVAITGFGVFEKKVRAARTARNPRTGEAVKVKKTSIPAFRAGTGFRELVASGKVPKAAAAKKTAAKAATKTAATKAATTRAAATKTAATRAAATKTAAAKTTKAAPAKKTTAKSTKAAAAPAARKTTIAKTTPAPKKSATARKR
jgi:DNA-binding protein HU-beta